MVVPLKQYPYDRWCAIAQQVNGLRAQNCGKAWEPNDIWLLWQQLFRTP